MEVHRQYTFEDGGNVEERVMWAGLVWFPPQGSTNASASSRPQETRFSPHVSQGLPSVARPGREGLFGPFHASQHLIWGQPTLPSSDQQSPRLVRTLVVCRREQATAFYPSGDDFKFHLPFVVDLAFPLPLSTGGILLQRALTRAEKRKIDKDISDGGYSDPRHQSLVEALEKNQGHGSEPRAYVLMNPFHEAKKVIEASVIDGKMVEEGGPLEYTDEILFSADDPYPFVLAYDKQEDELVFYLRHRVPLENKPLRPSTQYMRPGDLIAPPTTKAEVPRPSLHRAGSAFTTGDRRASTMQGEATDRTRGGPRISRGGKIDVQHSAVEAGSRLSHSTAELQAVLDPFSLPPSVPPQAANSRLLSQNKARVSARGDGSLILEDIPHQGIHGASEVDLRETTMMMGLERNSTAERSELVLERLYTWKAPR
jgi:anaphase-promoting complex subunit 1